MLELIEIARDHNRGVPDSLAAIREIIHWGAATPQSGSRGFGQDVSGDLHQIELAFGVFRLPRNPRDGIGKTPIRVAGRQVIGVCRVERLRGSL